VSDGESDKTLAQ